MFSFLHSCHRKSQCWQLTTILEEVCCNVSIEETTLLVFLESIVQCTGSTYIVVMLCAMDIVKKQKLIT